MGHLVNTAAIGSGKGLQFLTVCRALREVLRKVCQFGDAIGRDIEDGGISSVGRIRQSRNPTNAGRSLNQPNRPGVACYKLIRGYQQESLGLCLGNENSIERILM